MLEGYLEKYMIFIRRISRKVYSHDAMFVDFSPAGFKRQWTEAFWLANVSESRCNNADGQTC